ncbi:MAG TPA: histidine--tRNA ligase [Chitinophagaceae bacterium]|nr:histidine--tRNA ligase [Chitinophagaceae bacterium]
MNESNKQPVEVAAKANKPTLPQGTRDFGAAVVRKREYIFNTIKTVFELYGFQPLETPAMENLETLLGKYGEEGDKLIFKILNNGLDHAQKQQDARAAFEKVLEGKNTKLVTERALRYDLTIPFARYVAMNHAQLSFPFKRYQVQPVWRADRPQRGRYREFYQCDADVVGSYSLINEVELVTIYHRVLTSLKIDYELKINSRKILAALAECCGGTNKMVDITIAIDKLDKIGSEKVREELLQKGLTIEQVSTIEEYLQIDGTNEEKLDRIRSLLGNSDNATKGIQEMQYVLSTSRYKQKQINLSVDLTLARGLNYYTGIIFEAKAPQQVKIGSIGGGGRYDDLTGLFGVPGVPGVGISFGVDRIYDVLEELDLFPQSLLQSTKVLFFNLGEEESKNALILMEAVRAANIAAEIFHEPAKMDKQFKYAEKKCIPLVVIIGSKEIETRMCNLKVLKTGEQQQVAFDKLPEVIASM